MSRASRSYSVHPEHIQAVKLTWRRQSGGRDRELAEKLGLDLSSVNRFLIGKPVEGLHFLDICQSLKLDWREIAGFGGQERNASASPLLNQTNAGPAGTSRSAQATSTPNAHPHPEEITPVDQAINELVSTLCEMLRRLTRKAGDLLNADRTSIFLLDQQLNKLGSLNAEDGDGGSLLIEIPVDKGIAGFAAASAQVINIPFDVYDDPRSEEAKKTDQTTGYRTYTILAWPLLGEQKNLIAVVQLINKLQSVRNPDADLAQRIDPKGFTPEDEALFTQFAPTSTTNS